MSTARPALRLPVLLAAIVCLLTASLATTATAQAGASAKASAKHSRPHHSARSSRVRRALAKRNERRQQQRREHHHSQAPAQPTPAPEPTPTPTPAPAPAPAPEPTPAPAPEPTPVPSADTTAPSVSWKSPSAGVTVKGNLDGGSGCEANASDDHGVSTVVFKLDGATLNTEVEAPWNCHFDTTKVSDGSHTLTATAYDAADNSRTASITVNVSNAVAPAPTPEPTPTPTPSPSPSGMIVGLDAGNYGSSGATDVHGAVNTVRYDTERGVSGLEAFKKAGLRIQLLFPGPYNSGGVCALDASAWASETLSYYKTNTNPTQTPAIEALNEPAGTWFWGPNAESSANAVCYRNLLKKTHEAFTPSMGPRPLRSSAPWTAATGSASAGPGTPPTGPPTSTASSSTPMAAPVRGAPRRWATVPRSKARGR